MKNKTYGNQLSFRTFDSSNVNQVEFDLPELSLEEKEIKNLKLSSDYGFSDEIREINTKNYNYYKSIVASEGQTIDETINYENSEDFIELTDVIAQKNSKVNLILNYTEKMSSKFRSSILRLILEENSTVNIFIIQLEKDKKVVESIAADIKEGAKLNIYQYELGSVQLFTNFRTNLIGERSSVNVNSVYFGYNMNEINMLYDVFHIAENSNSNIVVNGALRDSSYKNFKSTLDFKKGSKGAVGSEEEYAILLSDDVLALSVPVLLAHEDDVQGNHAASAGKIDPNILFYLMSRGLDEQQAESLIILSKFARAIDAIKDEELKAILNGKVQEIVRR